MARYTIPNEDLIKWEPALKKPPAKPNISDVIFIELSDAKARRLMDVIKISSHEVIQDRTQRRLAMTHQLTEWLNLNHNFARIIQVRDQGYKNARDLGISILNVVRRDNLPLRVWWNVKFSEHEVYIWRLNREVTDSQGNVVGYNSPFKGAR